MWSGVLVVWNIERKVETLGRFTLKQGNTRGKGGLLSVASAEDRSHGDGEKEDKTREEATIISTRCIN
jgi:hypothetical protein